MRKLFVIGLLVSGSPILWSRQVHAGGLFLPGSGAVSTSRAGAAVASADDGEALSINPAGLAKAHDGFTITISAALISYSMQFTRSGSYDPTDKDMQPWEDQPYQTVKNEPKPPLGIGTFQPIPVVAVISDLGGRVKGLHVAGGLYAPSGYPFRDMTGGYEFNADPAAPPPPTRYDTMTAESMLLFPTLAASYRVLPELDVGLRFSAGRSKVKTSVVVQGTPGNVSEWVGEDTLFNAEVEDGFIPAFAIGVAYRPLPALELGAVYNSSATLRMKGTAKSIKGPGVDPTRVIGPIPDDQSRCEPGGDFETQRACITVQLPQTAYVGARYKFLDEAGAMRGDVELNVGWENWGAKCDFSDAAITTSECASPSQIHVKLDTGLWNQDMSAFVQPVQVNFVNLGLEDTFTARLGGSYHFPIGDNKLIARTGVAYDTAAAKPHFYRASFDGAARISTMLGAAYRTTKWEANLGGGAVFEGKNTNPDVCNPTPAQPNCVGGAPRPLDQRQGPDPTSPLLTPETQFENPFNQGTIESSYILFMLGFSTWF
jgi:long-subunit fatty acid transport protein